MNGERPRKGGAHTGLAATDRVPDHHREVSDRLRAIDSLSRPEYLAGWAALHLAAVREFEVAA